MATVEAHLAENPNDVQGWSVLAPAYKREKRWSDAAEAYANILRLAPANAQNIADYAEMLVFANEGMVSDEAQRAFTEALKLDLEKEPRPSRYYDMALKQEGKKIFSNQGKGLMERGVDLGAHGPQPWVMNRLQQGKPCRRRTRRR